MSNDTTVAVQLQKYAPNPADDPFIVFYNVVRNATAALGYQNYSRFVSMFFCDEDRARLSLGDAGMSREHSQERFCFTGTRGYDQLVEVTSLFVASQSALLETCCVDHRRPATPDAQELIRGTRESAPPPAKHSGAYDPTAFDVDEINRRFAPGSITFEQLNSLRAKLFDRPGALEGPWQPTLEGGADPIPADPRLGQVLTFMQQLLQNQPGVPLKDCTLGGGNCYGMLVCKLQCPPMLELIWSYWMEQGMLVQGINALSLRFQNRRYPGVDGLKRFDVSPLRPLSNILWGYVQREQNRLSLARRAYEYDHHYGLRLKGQAVPPLAPADSRLQFIEAFHRLLQEACRYYRTSMDTTMNADAFPALNCLRELHLTLAEGAHNQFGDLPTTARAEMLLEQWLMARPEVRDFLGGRPGVPYPEGWMPHMDTLRQLMDWNDASIRHYRDLATFGEQLLLSIRYLPWSIVTDSTTAATWLVAWRPEVQAYVHAYRSVTGVDLNLVDQPAIAGGNWAAQPADLIGQRHPVAAAQRIAVAR